MKELNENDLKEFLNKKNVEYELLKFEKPVISSKDAYEQVKGEVIKSILIICDNKPIICILKGEDKINFEKLKVLLDCKEVRLAKAKEVKEITGYDIGSLPPIGHKTEIWKIVDKKILDLDDNEILYLGGGSHYHLLKIKKKELLKIIENFEILEIT